MQADQSAFLDRQMRLEGGKRDIDAEIGSSSRGYPVKGHTESQKINGSMEWKGHFMRKHGK